MASREGLFIVAKSHECNEVLDPSYTPDIEPEEQELFEAKQTFMFSVFNNNLQTDMGKTIVRRHLANTDAQAVSSKGASKKRRLAQYFNKFKGTTEQFVKEYACYGKGHTIHSSGQIEWFKNSVDDRSVQVGGKQRICTIDGYAMPLTYRGGLMYLSILGKPTDTYLERYPAVHLTGTHEWDTSVLDFTHPSGDGEPPCSNDPDERFAFHPNYPKGNTNSQYFG